jgi:hypothetical protein
MAELGFSVIQLAADFHYSLAVTNNEVILGTRSNFKNQIGISFL